MEGRFVGVKTKSIKDFWAAITQVSEEWDFGEFDKWSFGWWSLSPERGYALHSIFGDMQFKELVRLQHTLQTIFDDHSNIPELIMEDIAHFVGNILSRYKEPPYTDKDFGEAALSCLACARLETGKRFGFVPDWSCNTIFDSPKAKKSKAGPEEIMTTLAEQTAEAAAIEKDPKNKEILQETSKKFIEMAFGKVHQKA